MALTSNHPVNEFTVSGFTSSLGATPLQANMRAPFRGKILKVGVVQSTAVSGTSTVTFAINGTSITGGAVAVTGGAANTGFTASPTAANTVVEDDIITATPAGAGTSGVTGAVWAVIRRT